VTDWFGRRASFTVVDGDDSRDVTVCGPDSSPAEDVPVVGYGSAADGDATVDSDRSDSRVRLAAAVRDVADHHDLDFPVPADEADRLAALSDYDFSAPALDAHLDGLATAVKESLDASIGFIGMLTDDAEQFVATDGVDWATLPREETVCTYGILRDGPLVISDLDEDDRISREAIESDHDLSFYAGAPLRTADGHCLGMVCVLDDRDRSFTSDDERALTWFAEQVMANVERRGTN